MIDDIAPPPDEQMTIVRCPTGHGWQIIHDREIVACFSTAADLASYINTYLSPLDVEAGIIPRVSGPVHQSIEPPEHEPMPLVFQHQDEPPPRRLWKVFTGGRA